MKHSRASIVAAFMVSQLCVLAADATNVLDQFAPIDQADSVVRVQQDKIFAQTFTPSMSGQLRSIRIYGGRNNFEETNPLLVNVTTTDSLGTPDVKSVLASARVVDGLDWDQPLLTVEFDRPPVLQRERLYALTFSCPGSFNGVGLWSITSSNAYPRGRAWARDKELPWVAWAQVTEQDIAEEIFFETWMEPTMPVVEAVSTRAVQQIPQRVKLKARLLRKGSFASTITAPQHGTVSGTFPNIVYLSNLGFSGTDEFAYVITNGPHSATGKVSLVVDPLPSR